MTIYQDCGGMSQLVEFKAFSKIARLSRDIIVTEKIDGTNAQVCIELSALVSEPWAAQAAAIAKVNDLEYAVFAGSRSRWLKPGKTTDNYGFAGWVAANAEELVSTLGVGRHYGEWWGVGINRAYGLTERRFSLFNVGRWGDVPLPANILRTVPVLYSGAFDIQEIDICLTDLEVSGSRAASRFKPAEGVIVFHTAGNVLFKKTIKDDEKPKSEAA